MMVFDKFRNCITEPRCRDCEGIPGVCEEDHQSVTIPKALALDVLDELKKQDDMIPIHAVADWLAGYAAPPNLRPTSVYNQEEISVLWMMFLKQFKEDVHEQN